MLRNPWPKGQPVPFPRRIDNRVHAIAEVEDIDIGSAAPHQHIIARATFQLIYPVSTGKLVVAFPTDEQVIPFSAI